MWLNENIHYNSEYVMKGDRDHLPRLFRRTTQRLIQGFFPALILMFITVGVDKAFGIWESHHGHDHWSGLNDKTSVSNVLNIYRFALILEGVFFFDKPDVLINMWWRLKVNVSWIFFPLTSGLKIDSCDCLHFSFLKWDCIKVEREKKLNWTCIVN